MTGLPTPRTTTDELLAAVVDRLDTLIALSTPAPGGEPARTSGQIELTEPKPARRARRAEA